MDAAGLAIGAAALLTLFKTCLEMCDTIECGRRYGSDFEVLTTKVGIERVRLLLWGDSVGLPGLDLGAGEPPVTSVVVDPRLQDPASSGRHWLHDAALRTAKRAAERGLLRGLGNALATTFRRTYTRFQEAAVQTQRAATVVTTARWAIKDKRRFQRFIEELRDFNDSLGALFPDLDENVRQEMAGEIKSATNLENLQIVEQAVTDMEAHDELVEAASVRITELSQYTRSLADDHLDIGTMEDTLDTGEEDGSTAGAGGVNVNRLAKQLEKLEVVLRANLKGSLHLSIWHIFGGRYSGFLAWEGVESDEYRAQVDRGIEYRRPSYPAWTLMYAPEKTQNVQENWADHDSEAGRKYEGRYPGTRTVEGYAADFSAWARRADLELAAGPPEHKMGFLVERLRSLQVERSLPWNEETIIKDVEELIGPASFTSFGNSSAGGTGGRGRDPRSLRYFPR
ncbi:TPR domain containing protein [Colletotrichum tofieldiae]|nr:TPR domain containing protein [Colletotrichum tofieldiae]